jgi:FkbM family methyltransferase
MDAVNFAGIRLQGDRNAPSSLNDMLEMFEHLKPKPSSHPLMRIGGNRDGSYLVPEDLDGIVACFSPGVCNFKYFEDVLVDAHGVDCHMCDYSSDVDSFHTPLREGKQTFAKKWIGPTTEGNAISLDDWIRELAPDGDLLLQMDIEGAEYRTLLSVPDDTLVRFRIIVIEVHWLAFIQSALVLDNVMAPFFRKLGRLFSVVHAHPNNCCGEFVIPGTSVRIPRTLELTYIRKDRLSAPTYVPHLPHPSDVSQNDRSKLPLFLGEEWAEGGRTLRSKIKMMRDRAFSPVVILGAFSWHYLSVARQAIRTGASSL